MEHIKKSTKDEKGRDFKIAIAHDFLSVLGGAERVTLALTEIFPDAPVYTLFYNEKVLSPWFKGKNIITSRLQKKAKFLNFRYKYFLPFMSKSVEEFDFSKFNVVISSSSAWMKGIITKPETLHISYCHTPTRFLWVDFANYFHEMGFLKKIFAQKIVYKLRTWDMLAADRVDFWIANSNITKQRIKKYYRHNSEIIYPPTDENKFTLSNEKKDYFLIVSRLSAYKMVDIAVDAFNKLGLNLIIIGDGAERKNLEEKAKSNIKFLGFKDDEEILKYYKECRAFIFPTFYEDFGLTPVEAMLCGKPVIAASESGSKESVVSGITGEFFEKPQSELLISAVKKFLENEKKYNPHTIRDHALKFGMENFQNKIKNFVNAKINDKGDKNG